MRGRERRKKREKGGWGMEGAGDGEGVRRRGELVSRKQWRLAK